MSAYQERDKTKRKRFQTNANKKEEERIVYVDESSFNNSSKDGYGYSKKGQRSFSRRKGRASDRKTVVSAQKQGKSQATIVFNGNMNKETFIIWIKKALIPTLKKGDIVVMDNASFHKDGIIRRLLRKAGCGLWYLPTYSPDLNPILNYWEHYWAKVKNFIASTSKSTDGEMENLLLRVCNCVLIKTNSTIILRETAC